MTDSQAPHPIETLYNEHVADVKLKAGTKYEQLTAFIFKSLCTEDVVFHDLTLRGDGSEVPHQIDVIVDTADRQERILIECKCLGRNAGLPMVRQFWAQCEQLKPDRKVFLSTNGFAPNAVQYAKEKGIVLGVLRNWTEEDWNGRIREVNIQYTVSFELVSNVVAIDFDGFEIDARNPRDYSESASASFVRVPTGDEYSLREIGHIAEGDGKGREVGFDKGSVLIKEDGSAVPVSHCRIEYTAHPVTQKLRIDGRRNGVAVLLLSLADGSIDRPIYDKQLAGWTIDGNREVVIVTEPVE